MQKQRTAALCKMRNIKKKEKQKNMCQNAFFSCLQGIWMSWSTREEQNMNVWSAKKKIQYPKKKCSALFRILFLKNSNLKINVKKKKINSKINVKKK